MWGLIVKNNHFIQQTLMSEMDEDFKRLEFNLTNYKSKVLEHLLNKYDL